MHLCATRTGMGAGYSYRVGISTFSPRLGFSGMPQTKSAPGSAYIVSMRGMACNKEASDSDVAGEWRMASGSVAIVREETKENDTKSP